MKNISGNEESVKFDSSFDILASRMETNVLKAWKVVKNSHLAQSSSTRKRRLRSNIGVTASGIFYQQITCLLSK
jgi:hypothetical protein